MKKILTILFVFIAFQAISQPICYMGAGYTSVGNVVIGDYGFGFIASRLKVDGEIKPVLNRKSNLNDYLGLEVGFNLLNTATSWSDFDEHTNFWSTAAGFSLFLEGGFVYDYKSADNRSLNSSDELVGMEAIKMITETGGLFFNNQYFFNSRNFETSFGVVVKFQ